MFCRSCAQKSTISESSETQKSSPTKFFVTVRQKILVENRDTTLTPTFFCIKTFETRKYLKTGRVPLRIFLGTVRQKPFDRKLWYTPLVHNFCRYPKLVKHWRVPLQNSLALVRVDFCLWAVKMTRVVRKVPHFGVGIVWGTIPSDLPVFWIIVPGCSRNG